VAVAASRYRIHYDPGVFERARYLAGSDARRLNELTGALADPTVRAVFCARGGYGSARLLPKLAAAPESPAKPLLGFSDFTSVHLWRQQQGLISIHGPVITQLGRQPAVADRLFCLLESSAPAEPLRAETTLVAGCVEGPLLGGNLSVFSRLLGTPFMPLLDGAVLLLEDVGESPYRLDRMWTHLELAGVFRRIRGIALGSFTACEQLDQGGSYTSLEVLRDLAEATALPCAGGFPIGHGDLNEAVPLGARVRLDATARTLIFLEAAVSEQ
jgi:muramoyltetrapeptide carboxypeptidase